MTNSPNLQELVFHEPDKPWRCLACGMIEPPLEVVQISSNVRRWKNHFFAVGRCAACRSISSLNQVELDLYYKDYPLAQGTLDYSSRFAYSWNLNRFEKLGLTPNHSILDYGCGPGILLEFLKSRGYQNLTGYDPYSDRFSDRTVLNRKYKAIFCMDVVEHVDDTNALFSLLARCLDQEGLLIISTPRADGINLTDHKPYIHSLHQPYHRCIFSEKGILRIAESEGFQLLKLVSRSYLDTPYPFVSDVFFRTYMLLGDDTLDVALDPPPYLKLLTSPRLWFLSLAGYLYPSRSDMVVIFRRAL